jgi:hypothetical protein
VELEKIMNQTSQDSHNPTLDRKLDYIFEDYRSIAGWTSNESTNPERTRNIPWLKKELRTLIADEVAKVIGDDEPIRYEDDTLYGDTNFRHQDVIYGRNELRAEQRERIATIRKEGV